MIFKNRDDAGLQLADRLARYRGMAGVVLGLPRGGLPVARPVADALKWPLDVLVARKIGAPGHAEFAIGAITARGTRVLNEQIVPPFSLPAGYLAAKTAEQQAVARKREAFLRDNRPAVPLAGKTVILVDDGIATGMTMQAAVEDVRAQHPARIVVASPVMAPDAYETFLKIADDVVAVAVPDVFFAVGQFYRDFNQTTDEEARDCLSPHAASA
ncbi:MAG: phosphoribosyltransferase [Candidatus Sericytochromatia bacterium]|nr:phosphoribosyltransferase [Candidatus Sericytochromatia bacterium]